MLNFRALESSEPATFRVWVVAFSPRRRETEVRTKYRVALCLLELRCSALGSSSFLAPFPTAPLGALKRARAFLLASVRFVENRTVVRHCMFSDARAVPGASVGRGTFAKCARLLPKFRENIVVSYPTLRHATPHASKARCACTPRLARGSPCSRACSDASLRPTRCPLKVERYCSVRQTASSFPAVRCPSFHRRLSGKILSNAILEYSVL